ncbi:hypothetical protein DM450_12730 [Sphingomonas sp. IC081]|nr:hypothetical protein DM450_12730 [Sphingomonas sp. IC081]
MPGAARLVPFLAGASLLARGDHALLPAAAAGEEGHPALHHARARQALPRPGFAMLALPGLPVERTAAPLALRPPLPLQPLRAALRASAAPVALAARLRPSPGDPQAAGEAPLWRATPVPEEMPAAGPAVLPASLAGLELPAPPDAAPDASQPAAPALAAARRLPVPGFGLATPGAESGPAVSAQLAPAQLTPASAVQTFPAGAAPVITYDDEVILAVRIATATGTSGGEDTVIAYGTREGLYLPLGALARTLDLPIAVGDEGHYANGWFLSEDRQLTINLREGTAQADGRSVALAKGDAQAFDGELYLRAERIGDLLPLSVTPNLRDQSVTIRTKEPFPFEQRLTREAERERLDNEQASAIAAAHRFPREETPWLPISLPMADIETRAVSDTALGERVESDLRLAGDLAWMSAEVFLTHSTRDGLTAAHVELGRTDPDRELLGPLHASAFALGDVATSSLPVGLRGVAGRGATLTNAPVEAASVFDRIDLRGALPDGYEVELYRNGVLAGSTRQAINGQYQFLQVPVDYGLNLFRLVFYGPQGQRSEEVRRISVGDGRLSKGQLVYTLGAVQKDENLLGITAPHFIPGLDHGRWRASAQLAYGLTSQVTGVVGGGWFDRDSGDRWLASAGLRTGLGGLAAKLDLAMQDGATVPGGSGKAGRAIEAGLGGAGGGRLVHPHPRRISRRLPRRSAGVRRAAAAPGERTRCQCHAAAVGRGRAGDPAPCAGAADRICLGRSAEQRLAARIGAGGRGAGVERAGIFALPARHDGRGRAA